MQQEGDRPIIDAVVIGRNEGERLMACLRSLKGRVRRIIYVDSGSSDGSVAAALSLSAVVVELEMTRPFTAARARNAGLQALGDDPPHFVQFVDGDCAVRMGWIDRALDFILDNPGVAVVCGRRRERHPEASCYNALIDAEWNTGVGEAAACGGDALMRVGAVCEVGGFREDLIAGEEPELCLRLRAKGWKIWRLDAEMTWHDANITRFAQWWKRTERAGHAFAEGASRFSTRDRPHWRSEVRRIWLWGAILPAMALFGALLHPAFLLLLLAYPLQVLRLRRRLGWFGALMNTLGKLAELIGALRYHGRRISGRGMHLIEYK